jgi:hypothetical protein
MNRHIEDPVDAQLLEVVVYRHGQEVTRESCPSGPEAAAIVARWEEEPGVTCEIIDLTAAGRTVDDIEKPESAGDIVDPHIEVQFDNDEYR